MSTPERVAAIDIGTNTVLLLIAEHSAAGPVAIEERATITRLGQGVDRTQQLAPDASARTLACLSEYASVIRNARVSRLSVVGTSALRDAAGAQDFLQSAERLLGSTPRVIGGEEEAELSFIGTLSGLAIEGPVTVFDIGGGSTEIIFGHAGTSQAVESAISLNLGSVRLHERHLHDDPPAPEQLARVREDVKAALAQLPASERRRVVGVAGTLTTLAAIEAELEPYDGARVHGSMLATSAVRALVQRLAALSSTARRSLRGLEEKRADVIVAGAVIAAEVLDWCGAEELVVSDRGVRWGLAQRLLSPQ
ncbi:MAG TPA: Ppx/GppA phosphatase family protein [Polyangiaceae bacterium]|nr:Ppx/GppA phosphatase family protein [Polyangiaceae bacterium]